MQKPDKESIWKQTLQAIEVSVSPAIFKTWLSQTHLVSLKKLDAKRYLAEIGCNSPFVRATVETRYFGLIQDTLIKILEAPTDINFTVKQQIQPKEEKTETPLFSSSPSDEEYISKLGSSRLNPGFTFSNFAVSSSNQMAFAAAEAIAQKPGSAYNPLFLWGGVGVGKTHLMHAVGVKLLKESISRKVLVCTGEEFTNDIIKGIREKTTQMFRDKYRKLNALFIDDIQFIAGKDTVQEEFFHTFNTVLGGGGQIILTSDRPPSEISKLEERLRSRFEAGLIVDISPPDFELRCAIVQIKSAEKNLNLTQEMVHLIAGNLPVARKIEGFLVRLTSEVKLKNIELNEEVVKNLLGRGADLEEKRINSISPEQVVDIVCNHYSISKRALMGKARARMVARPRQLLMYLLRTELKLPLEEVGRVAGGRDHSTVMHAVDKITELASVNNSLREDILKIKSSLS